MSHIRSLAHQPSLPSAATPGIAVHDTGVQRMFGDLPAWQPAGATSAAQHETLKKFAEARMYQDPGADLPLDNREIPAGYTYFGQFVEHDLTFGQGSPDGALPRAAKFDLSCLYGSGPDQQPYLFDTSRTHVSGFTGYFLIGSGENPNEPDLPRNSLKRALIGDVRNDENLILAQLHLALLQLHNRVLEAVVGSPAPADEGHFLEAQRIVRWFYQYLVWNDFAHRVVQADVHFRCLWQEHGRICFESRNFDWRERGFLPIEFTAAAFRFTHSMIRPGYQINQSCARGAGIERPLYGAPGSTRRDMRGQRLLPRYSTIQWDCFFPFPSCPTGLPQMSQRIDSLLARTLCHLPTGPDSTESLAYLDLLAGWQCRLPSGTSVARAMGIEPLPVDRGSAEDSLWVYILLEAEALGGSRLGPVGSEIVGEVLAGLLHSDTGSYVRQDPRWTPGRETALPFSEPLNGTTWEVADLLRASGAPVSRNDVLSSAVGSAGHDWNSNS